MKGGGSGTSLRLMVILGSTSGLFVAADEDMRPPPLVLRSPLSSARRPVLLVLVCSFRQGVPENRQIGG